MVGDGYREFQARTEHCCLWHLSQWGAMDAEINILSSDTPQIYQSTVLSLKPNVVQIQTQCAVAHAVTILGANLFFSPFFVSLFGLAVWH